MVTRLISRHNWGARQFLILLTILCVPLLTPGNASAASHTVFGPELPEPCPNDTGTEGHQCLENVDDAAYGYNGPCSSSGYAL